MYIKYIRLKGDDRMKKYLILALIFLFSVSYGEENSKGEISLTFNGEKILLPINIVTLKKEDKILISISAEQSNDKARQLFNLQWETEKLSANDEDLSMYDAFSLNVVNNNGDGKEELRFRLNDSGNNGELFVRKGNRTWELSSMAMKFNIENVSFEDSSILIEGSLSFQARDTKGEDPMKPISQIEDCKFKVVI